MRHYLISILYLLVTTITFSAPAIASDAYQESYQDSQRLERSGSTYGAFEVAQRAFELSEQDASLSYEKKIEVALHAGRLALLVDAPSSALYYFERAAWYTESLYGVDARQLLVPLSGILESEIGRYPNSDREIRAAMKRLDKVAATHLRTPSKERFDYYMLKAQALATLQNGQGARNYTRKAANDAEHLGDVMHIGDAYSQWGLIELQYRQHTRAIKMLKKALVQYETVLPPGDEKILKTHTAIAVAYIRDQRAGMATDHIQYVGIHQSEKDRDNPEPLYQPPAKFPQRAVRMRKNGTVTIQFTITIEGRVVDPVILESDPPGLYDEPAKAMVKRWRYAPRVVDGEFREMRHTVYYMFTVT